MRLEKLELSGFKSFPKTTVLELPHAVTAVVGPNGSGKSNVKEAIQWVLGEQSIKSLRGKKGEDLIWNGSTSSPQAGGIPRMGKASVTLVFDNRDGRIPLDFEEVRVGRKIFRDGLNEYYLNDSQVRLKDVAELMARIGLGETKHNIIGQGEVDRTLLSSPRERKEMLEEALGLRLYQLKKSEAERKLDATEENMRQVEALLREISPHLKFLGSQAKKAEARGRVEAELKELQKIYFAREAAEIEAEKKRLEAARAPSAAKQDALKKESEEILAKIAEAEKRFGSVETESETEKRLAELEHKDREIEREVGHLEGRLEAEKEKAAAPRAKTVDIRQVREEIQNTLHEIREILETEDRIEIVRSHLLVLVEDIENFLKQAERPTAQVEITAVESALASELKKTIASLREESKKIAEEIKKYESSRRDSQEKFRASREEIQKLDQALRQKRDEERELVFELQRFEFEEERLRDRQSALKTEVESSGLPASEIQSVSAPAYENSPADELKRKIERLRGKLEEIGGIDPAVLQEYQEAETRHSFLTTELEDLKKASTSLKELVRELEKHIDKDFKEGFSKIKEEFHKYFRIIFGGGKATLSLSKHTGRGPKHQEEIEEKGAEMEAVTPEEEGIEISVELPQKRIKGLAMLSGGERALTSVALLFAITAVNPPPFLVLDETDAALDEANSQRYAAILKELSKRTQLILVTHNRETMKSAGVLYGVTMGDDGASRLLSLKLEEAEVYTNR